MIASYRSRADCEGQNLSDVKTGRLINHRIHQNLTALLIPEMHIRQQSVIELTGVLELTQDVGDGAGTVRSHTEHGYRVAHLIISSLPPASEIIFAKCRILKDDQRWCEFERSHVSVAQETLVSTHASPRHLLNGKAVASSSSRGSQLRTESS